MIIGLVSSYVPKFCGVGTYMRDLAEAGTQAVTTLDYRLVAIEAQDEDFRYSLPVLDVVKTNDPASYALAGRRLAGMDIIHIQFEYGLPGGTITDVMHAGRRHRDPLGDNIFELLRTLPAHIPVVVTLHTILINPDPQRKEIILRLARRVSRFIVMTQDAKRVLVEVFGINSDQVKVIAHGVPEIPMSAADARRQLKIDPDIFMLLVTGLLNPNKGIAQAIRALPKIIEANNRARLFIVGQTHPGVIKAYGEIHRQRWEQLAEKLGVSEYILWVDKYLPLGELSAYFAAAQSDGAYLTLHGDLEQAASGTLAYAMGAGLIAISTRFRYAIELLADGHGFMIPGHDARALVRVVLRLFRNPELVAQTKARAAARGRTMQWGRIGSQHTALYTQILSEQQAPSPAG